MATFSQRTRTGVVGGKQGAVNAYGYIRGGPELAKALARLEHGLRDELLQKAVLAGGKVLEEKWKEQVLSRVGRGPGTAHYADAIEATARPGKKGATGLVALKRSVPLSEGESHPREYASRLEFGSARATAATLSSGRSDFASRGRAAVATLRPAFDSAQGRMLDAMSDELAKLIEDAT
jgi:hypothetical protein